MCQPIACMEEETHAISVNTGVGLLDRFLVWHELHTNTTKRDLVGDSRGWCYIRELTSLHLSMKSIKSQQVKGQSKQSAADA